MSPEMEALPYDPDLEATAITIYAAVNGRRLAAMNQPAETEWATLTEWFQLPYLTAAIAARHHILETTK